MDAAIFDTSNAALEPVYGTINKGGTTIGRTAFVYVLLTFQEYSSTMYYRKRGACYEFFY